MRSVLMLLATLATTFALGASAAPGDPVKVVYHINEGPEHAVQTLRNVRNHITIDPKLLIEEAKMVPSGVAEIARLQSQEGYAYLKP